MFKIGILFEDREFEHDIYELIRAFYPGSEIHSFYEKEEEACNLFFKITKQADSCVISYENAETKGVTSAEFIKGQSSDALVSCTDAENQDASVQKERAHAVRKERKDIVKIALYKLLVKLTGKTLPWGNLTGIRPAKLAMGLIESGMKNTEAAQEMRERYMVSPQKTALAITIANREREILKDIDYENGYSLYVGIPFCPSICLYCSFSSYPLKQWKDRVYLYLDALCKEIRAARLNIFKDRYQEMTFENNQEIMDMTMRTAYEMGMGPYYLYRQKNMKGNFENVGYAKVDKAGIYNILIMEEKQPIIAVGAGGSSKLVFDHGKRIERVENVKDVTNYIERIDEMIERKRKGINTWL